ncbi:MAG: methyl-accepting chemotaxis protein, partial [Candidatus Kryptonium sp.]
ELSDEIKPVVGSFKSLGETSSAKSMFIEMRIEEVLMEVEGILKDLEEQSHLISQMKVAVDEINKTVLYTSNIANHAMEQAAETQKLISTLEKASSEVESIVKFIREVAEQTNLLALNASIEAARAGEVGKGFAVVANEVKELARQTDQAGIEITKKINAIQNLHTNIIKTVESMISTFKEVKDYANIVASAVEEQTITLANIESQAQIHKERAELTSRAFHDLKEEYKSMSEDIQKNINFSLKLEEMSQKLLSSVEHFQTFKIDRRDLRRIRLGEETEFVYNQSQYKGVIKDISAGGAYILTNYKPDLHSNIKVKFKTELSLLEFEGTVVRVDKQGFALRWVKIDQESLLKLKGFLSQYYSPDLLEKEIEKFQKTSLI